MLSRKPRRAADPVPVTIELDDPTGLPSAYALDDLVAALDRAVLRLARSTQDGAR